MWTKAFGNIPDKEELEIMRRRYKPGTRIEIIQMDDPQSPAPGTRGTVTGVDDLGSVMCRWDNGSSLSLVYGQDLFKEVMTEKIKEQILAIRDTGETNMFDTQAVQRLAFEKDFYELVLFIEEDKKSYVHFILTGEEK